MRRAPLVSLALLCLAASSAAQTVAPGADYARLQESATAQDRAAALAAEQAARARAAEAAAEAARLTDERAIAAARLREAAANTAAAAARLKQIERERQAADASLAQQARAMTPLLPLMQRLSLYPAETLLAVPAQIGRAHV